MSKENALVTGLFSYPALPRLRLMPHNNAFPTYKLTDGDLYDHRMFGISHHHQQHQGCTHHPRLKNCRCSVHVVTLNTGRPSFEVI